MGYGSRWDNCLLLLGLLEGSPLFSAWPTLPPFQWPELCSQAFAQNHAWQRLVASIPELAHVMIIEQDGMIWSQCEHLGTVFRGLLGAGQLLYHLNRKATSV